MHLCGSIQRQQGYNNAVVDFQRQYCLRGRHVPIKTPPPKIAAEQKTKSRKETVGAKERQTRGAKEG